MRKYIVSVDQSTQGTKALLFDEGGMLVGRKDLPHRQIIGENGWVSHDPEEIYRNVLRCVCEAVTEAGVNPRELACMGLSNQRETALAWNRATGEPVCDAIVWQCSRSREICERVMFENHGPMIQRSTGIPVSPFFPASKLAWILENVPGADQQAARQELCFGTVDTWLLYRLTNGASYKTDYSNASRTQLLNLSTLRWDEKICKVFGLLPEALPEVCDSDAVFGETTLGGLCEKPIPICGVLGDSHAALFGQGCLERGMVKATYGTGSSVMMNIGGQPAFSEHGLVTSLAWRRQGRVEYVMEGNINYSGAVIRWLQNDLGMVMSAEETQTLAQRARPDDTTYLVPAFTGLGAPYWNNQAKAMLCGITRLTGRPELVKAGLECIAYQITDIVKAMEQDTGLRLGELRADGGATGNAYLMQFQSDLLNADVLRPDAEELSGIGAAYMAGMSYGLYDQGVFGAFRRERFHPKMEDSVRKRKYAGWLNAVRMVLNG